MLNEAKVVRMIQAKQVKKQKGASMIEYALVVAAVVGLAAIFFGTNGTITTAIDTKLDAVATAISS